MNFDEYLISRHKESQKIADSMETVLINKNLVPNWVQNFYLDMIKCDKYDTQGLSEEFKRIFDKSDSELYMLLKNYKNNQ